MFCIVKYFIYHLTGNKEESASSARLANGSDSESNSDSDMEGIRKYFAEKLGFFGSSNKTTEKV